MSQNQQNIPSSEDQQNRGIPIASVAVPQRGLATYGQNTGQGTYQYNEQAGQAESLSTASGYRPPPSSMVSGPNVSFEELSDRLRKIGTRSDDPNDSTSSNSQSGMGPLGTGFLQSLPRATLSGASGLSSGFSAPPNSYSTQYPSALAHENPPLGQALSQKLTAIKEGDSNNTFQESGKQPPEGSTGDIFVMDD